MNTCSMVLYMTYVEDYSKLTKEIFLTDELGFFEGFSRAGSNFLDPDSSNFKLTSLMSILFFFPDLTDFFYMLSPSFKQLFADISDWEPSVAIETSLEKNSKIYFVSSQLKRNDISTLRQLEITIRKLIIKQKSLDFVKFSENLKSIFVRMTPFAKLILKSN